jgi:hypothetical protein
MIHTNYSSAFFSIRRFTPWRDWTFDVRCSFLVSSSINLATSAARGWAETLLFTTRCRENSSRRRSAAGPHSFSIGNVMLAPNQPMIVTMTDKDNTSSR